MAKTVVMVADIGGLAHYHIGDEAIFTARLAWLRREFPGVDVVAVSEDDAFTAGQHSLRVLAEPELPRWADQPWVYRWRFPKFVSLCLEALSWWYAPKLNRLLAEIRRSAVLLICGGGNLTSSCSRLLRFRSLLAGYAEACGIPVVVTGQQIGPKMTDIDRDILQHWLPAASLIGVRDAITSAVKARELGVHDTRLWVTGDDALMLEPQMVPRPQMGASTSRPLIGLSFHNPGSAGQRKDCLAALATMLGPWLNDCNAEVLMLPHLRADVPYRCDIRLAHDFMGATGFKGRITVVDDPALRESHFKYLTGLCDFYVTTRFHAAVFALTTGVPVFALSSDDCTESKFNGLFAYFGLDWKACEMRRTDVGSALSAAWGRRVAMSAQLDLAKKEALQRFDQAQQRVKAVLEAVL